MVVIAAKVSTITEREKEREGRFPESGVRFFQIYKFWKNLLMVKMI